MRQNSGTANLSLKICYITKRYITNLLVTENCTFYKKKLSRVYEGQVEIGGSFFKLEAGACETGNESNCVLHYIKNIV